jgi:ribosomal protein S27E
MPVKKAEIEVADVIVKVACPECHTEQPSPHYAPSTGWDKTDVRRVGTGARAVHCSKCGNRFGLPTKVFTLMEGQA